MSEAVSAVTSSDICQTLSPGLQHELDSLRDQRDLYRSLLLSDPTALAKFLSHALHSSDLIRVTLRHPTREASAFRSKIERVQMELLGLQQALAPLRLPTVQSRLQHAAAAIQEMMLRAELTGNDLLPAMVLLEELCSHLLVAADCSAVHAPLDDDESIEEDIRTGEQRMQQRLVTALQQLCAKQCDRHGKEVSLVAMGLEDVPDSWGSAVFDLLGQLVRNAVEHGIETPEQRTALGKERSGTIVIELSEQGNAGYELSVQDDGAGLDADRIAEVAVKRGLLAADPTRPLDPSRVINLLFQPGMTTAHSPEQRGRGLQIVREHIQRLHGKLNIAAKRGQYVRFQISLPAQREGT